MNVVQLVERQVIMRIVLFAVLIAELLVGCEKLTFGSKPVAPPAQVATAPQYSPESDPARGEFEKAVDLIQGINWVNHDDVKASQFVEQLKQAYPDSPYSLIAEADLEFRMWMDGRGGVPEHMRKLVNQSFRKSRAIADAYVTLARLDLQQGNVGGSAENSAKAFKLAPDKPEVRSVMARIAQSKRAYDEAEQHYRKFIEVSQNPVRQSNTYFWMGKMFEQMNPPQLDKAEEAFQTALKLDPAAPAKLAGYADYLLYRRGDYEGSLFYLEQANQLMQSPSFSLVATLAIYAKWADGYANKGAHYKARTEKSVAPLKVAITDLRKIEAGTGISVDRAFVELAAAPALDYAVRTLWKAKVIKNIDVKTEGGCGCTALIKAADANNLELAKYLVGNKANVNGTNATGETALTRFILQKNWEAVSYLLDHGARVNFVDKDGMTPLQVVQVFADADIKGLRLLLERKADPTIPLETGYTLLLHAVLERNAELVALLVKHGADPNEKEGYRKREGDKPKPLLLLAAYYRYEDMVTALLNAGADPWMTEAGVEKEFKHLKEISPPMFKMIDDARAAHPRPTAANSGPSAGQTSQPDVSAKK
jgi:tetratricopeptide (TPR) repeat protein